MNLGQGGIPFNSGLALPQLPRVSCRLRFVTQQDATFPGYTGSIWRGQFGARLRQIACMTGARDCKGCPVKQRCSYAYLFETSPPENAQRMRKYGAVPHPLVLSPPAKMGRQEYLSGSDFMLELHLFGHACAMLPLILKVLATVGEAGLGRSRIPMQLGSIQSAQLEGGGEECAYEPGMEIPVSPVIDTPPESPDAPLRIRLVTPLRVVTGGRLANAERFTFRGFFSSLLRRISMLTVFHADQPLETDFSSLVKLAGNVPIEDAALHWQEWKRYSSRQKRLVPMGGLRGSITVDIRQAEALWPYLWLGQWTHVAKGTIMGLGNYQIENPDIKIK